MGHGLLNHELTHVAQQGGAFERADGYVTTLGHILVGGSTPAKLEAKLGFVPGYLGSGYRLLRLAPHERIKWGEFKFQAYTNLDPNMPSNSPKRPHAQFNARYSNHPIDQATKKKQIDQAVERMNRAGLDRICKVKPVTWSGLGYKPGEGVPQFELTAPKQFEQVATVSPGQRLAAPVGERIEVIADG